MPRVPVFSASAVYAGLGHGDAVDTVRTAFLEHASGTWTMPSKVYLDAAPDGDFRAMPAGGGGFAVLKWVTSFPGNPARSLPTVTGVVLLSDASTGALRALLDAGAVTALRTGAAAVLAAETLARPTVAAASVVGCGVNGRAVARAFLERERDVLLYDAKPGQAERPRRSWASARRSRAIWPRRSPPTSSSRSRRAGRSCSQTASSMRAST